jgi:hypothetical protein
MRYPFLCHAACLILAAASLAIAAEPIPLLNAHSHNDYAHPRPLLDALDQGFCSVEADIFLVDGELLVGHNRLELTNTRTLQALYLDPLRDRVVKNSGTVYPSGPPFSLLIDLKTDWHDLYPALAKVLAGYSNILTEFHTSGKTPRAITVILSGNRSREMFATTPVRFAAYDGELSDLDGSLGPDMIPWISANWAMTFKWRARGEFPPEEKRKLEEFSAKAAKQGRRLRFWGAPDKSDFWKALRDAKVDLINTDDLPGLKTWLLDQEKK